MNDSALHDTVRRGADAFTPTHHYLPRSSSPRRTLFGQTSATMKLIDKIAQRDTRRLFYMFEFFPPKTDEVHTPARAVCRP